jgi:hypothetical protein
MTSPYMGAERAEVNDERDDESYQRAVADNDPKLMAWGVIQDECDAAVTELERRQHREMRSLDLPNTDLSFSSLIEDRHAKERHDLAGSFARQYRNFCTLVNAGGRAADAAIADMWVRHDANEEAISDRTDVILNVARRTQRGNKRHAKIGQREQQMAQAKVIPLVGYAALKARDERRAQEAPDPSRIIAKPFVLRPTNEIPPREWLYGRHLIRKFLSTTFAPGAGGKTSLILAEALSMVTGRDLLKVGKMLTTGLRVWVWNGEDPKIEIERRLAAICKHYGITTEQLAGRLYVNSGRDTDLKIAMQDRNGTRIAKPDVEQIIAQMLARKIDVLVIDPAVSFHSVPENDNTAIDAFAKSPSGDFIKDCTAFVT